MSTEKQTNRSPMFVGFIPVKEDPFFLVFEHNDILEDKIANSMTQPGIHPFGFTADDIEV